MVNFDEIKQQISDIASVIVEPIEGEILEVKIAPYRTQLSIEIIADKIKGGISIDECAWINRMVNQKLEDTALIEQDYTISVCSPGIDRPLKRKQDFLKVKGRNVRFHLTEAIENKIEHSGIIQDVLDNNVIIKSKTTVITIPIEVIGKAVQVI